MALRSSTSGCTVTTRQAYLSCLVSEMILVTYKIDAHPPGVAGRRGRAGGPGDGTAPSTRGLARTRSLGLTGAAALLRCPWVDPGQIRADGFIVEAREIPHKGGRTLGHRISDGRSAVAYVTDHCPTALGPGPDGWGEYRRRRGVGRWCGRADTRGQLLAGELGGPGRVRPRHRRLRGVPGSADRRPAGGVVPPPTGPHGRCARPGSARVHDSTGLRSRSRGRTGT